MPILRHNKKPLKNIGNDSGFSLLEILVVLAIMGLMLSMVGARLFNTIEATRFSRTADAAIADILIYRAEAMLSREDRFIVTDSTSKKEAEARPNSILRRFTLPQNWQVTGEAIQISSSGICNGSRITLRSPEGRRSDFLLRPPSCKAERIPGV